MSHKIVNTFSKGAVNTDSAHEYVSPDTLVALENFDIFSDGNSLALTPSRGNSKKFEEVEGKRRSFLGSAVWNEKIYLFYTREGAVDSDGIIYEYDTQSGSLATVLQITASSLGFPEYDDGNLKRYVLSADVVDGIFLHWTWGVRGLDGELSGYGEPKRIHIQDAIASPTTYSNISANYDRPDKIPVSLGLDTSTHRMS